MVWWPGLLPHVLGESLAFVNVSWADNKNNRRSSAMHDPGNHVEMWLQAPLRVHWAQGDVDLYEICLTLCVVANS